MDQNFVAVRARLHYLLREKYESLKGLDCGHSVSYSGIFKLDGADHIRKEGKYIHTSDDYSI